MKTKVTFRKNTKHNTLIFLCIVSTVLLALLVVVIGRYTAPGNDMDISFKICSDNYNQEISLWEDENDGTYYCFLPSYTDLKDIEIKAPKKLCINGQTEKKKLDNIQLDKKVSFSNGLKEFPVVFMKSANVATLCINTKSGSMYEVHKNKGNKEQICMTLFDENGKVEYVSSDYSDSIKGRGQSSWFPEKNRMRLNLKIMIV